LNRVNPYLVGIHHQNVTLIIPNSVTGNLQAALIILKTTTNLQLEVLISLLNTLIKQLLQLLLTVSQPASTCSIRRHSLASLSLLNTVLLATLDLLEHGQRLLGGNSVGDVAEVNAGHELLGGHVRNDAPDRLAQCLGP
jgi:hypothetical protein